MILLFFFSSFLDMGGVSQAPPALMQPGISRGSQAPNAERGASRVSGAGNLSPGQLLRSGGMVASLDYCGRIRRDPEPKPSADQIEMKGGNRTKREFHKGDIVRLVSLTPEHNYKLKLGTEGEVIVDRAPWSSSCVGVSWFVEPDGYWFHFLDGEINEPCGYYVDVSQIELVDDDSMRIFPGEELLLDFLEDGT